ncbi:MAG TPA: PspC domain-containing protein [Allosphingosinicella sp.]|nr:PspC domain-containing protein [Allosphingosinicella sp.]
MPTVQPNLFARDDTMFGVCQALGEDFGFNPNWLRVAIGSLLLWNPAAMAGAYAAAGALVLLSRLLSPDPRPTAAPQPAAEQAPAARDEAQAEQLPLAA